MLIIGGGFLLTAPNNTGAGRQADTLPPLWLGWNFNIFSALAAFLRRL